MNKDTSGQSCECGCGELPRAGNRFVHGHNAREQTLTFDTKWIADPETGCHVWTGRLTRGGYGMFGPTCAHRRAWERAHGRIPDGLEIDHLCRNRRCVNPAHLEAVTPAENVRRGSRTQLTADQVATIRASHAPGKDMALAYGVARSTISMVRNFHNWREE